MKDLAQERSDLLETLEKSVRLLTQSIDLRLIPPQGAQLGYSLRGARDKNGVAAVDGGFVADRERAYAAGACEFGADEDIARIILTVTRFDPDIRSAASLQGSPKLLEVIESLLLEYRSFESKTPPGISTMHWGVASCCRDGVPDVCYQQFGPGNESTFIFFGDGPIDVTNNIIMISNRVINMEL